ncbi:hypothetical protein [Streptomyces sp. 8L]|uniref:hypothetical protein n=1 Tax=Streptomyces sp. 8L TaxID=2877242 RepID=UPI001CD5F919|nr:hypothetical protein [Streptomyces sp. 8L]MCA1217395.1 hypothetical protein [Streptomyces sp. 8L]
MTLWPAPKKPEPRTALGLLWMRRTQQNSLVEHGTLLWTSDAKPFVDWAVQMAYSADEVGPQYTSVLTALREYGIEASVTHFQGTGYLVKVDLPDSTHLVIGGPEGLPSRLDQVEQWQVQHESANEHIAFVCHGPDLHQMIIDTKRYLQATGLRYGGHHPLGALPSTEREDGPDKLYGLISDLSELRRVNPQAPGGTLMTIADADGNNGASIAVPAEVVIRMSRLLAVELNVIETYGG